MFVLFISIGEPTKFSSLFRDDKDVHLSNRVDVLEGEDMFIFIDDGGRYFLAYDFVEDGFVTH